MIVTEQQLTEAQKLVYGRRRIIDCLYQKNPEKFSSIQATDILSISLHENLVYCDLTDTQIHLKRKDILENFWKHRTRTPSFFDYKIWGSEIPKQVQKGTPIAALDYAPSVLEAHIGRPPRVSVTKNGERRLYFVDKEEKTCTCGSWAQLNKYQRELKQEFKKFTDIKFEPLCKHLLWSQKNLDLLTMAFIATKDKNNMYNPRLCVYHFDYLHRKVRYKITYDGISSGAKWLPKGEWKEKDVYTHGSRTPTGNCWDLFMSALSQKPPFKLIPYSESLGIVMNQARK